MIPVTETIALEDDELVEKFVRASGPGGQHVNTSSSAVELRFDARNSPSLPDDVKHRLERVAGSRMNQEGVIVIFAQSHRSQEMNRQDARARLVDLIEQATHKPKPRKKTRPTYASKLRRLEGKTKRSGVKAMRGRVRGED
jgi:ribosome-associated protein